MLRDKGLGANFCLAISERNLFLVGYAFVDDTDLVCANDVPADQTASLLQQLLTAWEGGIRTTGGAIMPEKSH
jgi:hypothetical protein